MNSLTLGQKTKKQQEKKFAKIVKEKQAVRLKVKNRRSQLSPQAIEHKSKQIRQIVLSLDVLKQAQTVMCYVSKGREVQTHTLIKLLLKQGKTAAVPFIVSKGIMKPAVITSFSQLVLAEFKTLQPQKLDLLAESIDLNIMPALAVSEAGDRIGWGGGFFDRFILDHQPQFNLSLAFDFQVFKKLPVSSFDQKVDKVVTESRCLDF